MTVSVLPKCDMPKTTNSDNETCSEDENPAAKIDHKESLLNDCGQEKPTVNEVSSTPETKSHDAICKEHKNEIRLFSFQDAPAYLQHNIYILSGYRGILDARLCLESVFWWTNETINIWSHIFGFLLFLGLTLYDIVLLKLHTSFLDKFFVAILLVCFQVCMFLSTLYHTFSCRSEHYFNTFLSLDLFGIALSLLAIYMSGIYYAFWCHPDILNFYLITVTVIFVIALLLQHPTFEITSNGKMAVFVAWAGYGIVPSLHWVYIMGGFDNPLCTLLLPRVVGMYLISGVAFLIYLTKVPERYYAGRFDYLGHSHQWWHLFVVFALYYWHNTGMLYAEYRMNHACSENIRFL